MPLTLNGTTGIAGVDGSAGTPALKGGTSTTAGVVFPAADTVAIATASTERARVDSTGNLLVGVTSANANGGVLQLKSGITFPATQVTSTDVNTLDDYEEGTWTPALSFTANTGITYSARAGEYVKIGSYVYIAFNITLSNKGSSTGSAYITGLPFTGSTSVTYKLNALNSFLLNSTIQTMLQIANGSSQADIKKSGLDTNIQDTDVTNSSQFRGVAVYQV